ncbi:MAG: hypothetical protein HRT99_01290 [Mycoplasmatales bacterium]|nr:hypothetical protein [Mycoplasmatales bacterium]
MKNIFKNMSKKVIIFSSVALVTTSAFAIGVSVAISKRDDSNPEYKINLNNPNGLHYFVSKINPKQMVPAKTDDLNYWDIRNDNYDQQQSIATSQNTSKELIIGTITKSKPYNNGLEKLIYDLIHAVNNGPTIILIFGTQMKDPKDPSLMKSIGNVSIENFVKLNTDDRKKYLKNTLTDQNSELLIAIKSVYMAHGKGAPSLTTDEDVQNALNNLGIK